MLKTSIDEVVIGAKLAEPIMLGDVLLCKAGVPISAQLKSALPKFGITEVTVESSDSDDIMESLNDLSNLPKSVYNRLLKLDISDLITCSKKIVDNLRDNDSSNDMLFALLDYDEGTLQHSVNVAYLAVIMGIHLHLPNKQLYDLALGSLLHDIGKLKIPHDILCKEGKLTDDEYALIKQHPYQGLCVLHSHECISTSVMQIILQHHEHYNGTGYPRKLKGSHIYKLARIVHICDVYEALCAKRSYKEPMKRREVRDKMFAGSNKLFDPILLQTFMQCIPLYLPGELVELNGRTGIVHSLDNVLTPIIYYNNSLVPLDVFEVLCAECA